MWFTNVIHKQEKDNKHSLGFQYFFLFFNKSKCRLFYKKYIYNNENAY